MILHVRVSVLQNYAFGSTQSMSIPVSWWALKVKSPWSWPAWGQFANWHMSHIIWVCGCLTKQVWDSENQNKGVTTFGDSQARKSWQQTSCAHRLIPLGETACCTWCTPWKPKKDLNIGPWNMPFLWFLYKPMILGGITLAFASATSE